MLSKTYHVLKMKKFCLYMKNPSFISLPIKNILLKVSQGMHEDVMNGLLYGVFISPPAKVTKYFRHLTVVIRDSKAMLARLSDIFVGKYGKLLEQHRAQVSIKENFLSVLLCGVKS